MKYLLIITDGGGVRNFLCSQLIDLLLNKGEVIIWHSLSPSVINVHSSRWERRVKWIPLPSYKENLEEHLLRQAKVYAQLYWRKKESSSLELKRLRAHPFIKARLANLLAESIGYFNANENRIDSLDKLHRKRIARNPNLYKFEEILKAEKPDVVFCTHQRSFLSIPAVAAAKKLGIPSATFIYSWDNLPKIRLPIFPDFVFVWSEYMKCEIHYYYPNIDSDKIFVIGTPQFEHYFDLNLIEEKASFFLRLGLDANRKVVCFSGDDMRTSPYDQFYLCDLAESFRHLPLEKRPQILFRRSPVDKSARYDWVLNKYPEIVVSNPLWVTDEQKEWANIIPKNEDISLLVNIVFHCDLNINLGSTMAMDFAIFDKPGIYFAYNPERAKSERKWSVDNIYKLKHFETVHKLQPIYWAKEPQSLANLVTVILENPLEKSENRRDWLKTIVEHPIKDASLRCFNGLNKIASN